MEEAGELLTQMLRMLRDRNDLTMTKIMQDVSKTLKVSPSTLHKWREGSLKPGYSALEEIIRIGASEAKMDRDWAEDMLRQAKHPQSETLLRRYFVPIKGVQHNLPAKTYTTYTGRDAAFATLLARLKADDTTRIIAIEGPEGVGKSALALEAGWYLYEHEDELAAPNRFEHIIWIPIHKNRQVPTGIAQPFIAHSTADDIFETIAEELHNADYFTHAEERHRKIYNLLRSNGRILLIIDGIDELEDASLIEAFLQNLPSNTKAIITTQFRGKWRDAISLKVLDEENMQKIVQEECDARHIRLTDQQVRELAHSAGGLPLAAWWAVHRIAQGMTVAETTGALQDAYGELLTFVFSNYFKTFAEYNPKAFHLLLALSFFHEETGARLAALAAVVAITEDECKRLLALLDESHLVQSGRSSHYCLLPLTQSYVAMLVKELENPQGILPASLPDSLKWLANEQVSLSDARSRWVQWYKRFIDDHQRETGWEWYRKYDDIQVEWANIMLLSRWCSRNTPEDLIDVWLRQEVCTRFTDIYGHWRDRIEILEQLRHLDQLSPTEHVQVCAMLLETRILMYTPPDREEIATLLQEAENWLMQPDVEPIRQWQVRDQQAFFLSRQGHENPRYYDEALTIVNDAQALIGDSPEHQRRLAEWWYRRGTILFYRSATGDLDEARDCFERAQTLGKQAHRQRVYLASLHWLAELDVRQRDSRPNALTEARQRIDEGLVAATRNRERRRIAGFRRAATRLEIARDDLHEASRQANRALTIYNDLGMVIEQQEMLMLLTDIKRAQQDAPTPASPEDEAQ